MSAVLLVATVPFAKAQTVGQTTVSNSSLQALLSLMIQELNLLEQEYAQLVAQQDAATSPDLTVAQPSMGNTNSVGATTGDIGTAASATSPTYSDSISNILAVASQTFQQQTETPTVAVPTPSPTVPTSTVYTINGNRRNIPQPLINAIVSCANSLISVASFTPAAGSVYSKQNGQDVMAFMESALGDYLPDTVTATTQTSTVLYQFSPSLQRFTQTYVLPKLENRLNDPLVDPTSSDDGVYATGTNGWLDQQQEVTVQATQYPIDCSSTGSRFE